MIGTSRRIIGRRIAQLHDPAVTSKTMANRQHTTDLWDHDYFYLVGKLQRKMGKWNVLKFICLKIVTLHKSWLMRTFSKVYHGLASTGAKADNFKRKGQMCVLVKQEVVLEKREYCLRQMKNVRMTVHLPKWRSIAVRPLFLRENKRWM